MSNTQATRVDHTWVLAVRNCWPDVAHSHQDKYISDTLTDPIGFRGASIRRLRQLLRRRQIESIAFHNVGDSPDPDTSSFRNANAPLLTRAEADGPAPPRPHRQRPRHMHDATQIPPSDTLCAIHPGTPVGFR